MQKRLVMGFIRNFSQIQIDKMQGEELFKKLKADVLKGEVFPAVRKNELHFYYKGGCLYKFADGSFKRDKNYEKYGDEFKELPPYERAKKENEEKFKNSLGGEAERQLLDRLYCHIFNPEESSNVVVLDIEVNLGGQVVKKCDLVLLNTQTDELMFVEAKVFSDSRVNVKPPHIPEVIAQVNTYIAAIKEQRQTILEQYARHVEIINTLFGTSYRPPKRLVEPAKLLVYGTPHNPTKNGEYTIDKINTKLGASNVLWVKNNENATLDDIWNALRKHPDIVVFDLETAGMNCEEDSIIEISAVKLSGRKITDEFHSFVACPQKLNRQIARLTGENNKILAGAPPIKDVLESFYSFADGCILASYNLSFDWKFIEHVADLCGLNFENDRIDILTLVREKLKDKVSNYKLSTVAQHFEIEYNKSNKLGEAKAVVEIFNKIK